MSRIVATQMLTEVRSLAEIQQAVDANHADQQAERTRTPLPPVDYVAPAYRRSGT